ncbi:energy transducer TonB [Hymenobacter sp. IS2118]|uniref:energy transducer TonB n=1 Tax=Hymenobacter sp. IS2118 TaxID=1505605 RepID=UPI00068EA018|nr:energy transducer TonB [Hymenobacter sp. IS2118]
MLPADSPFAPLPASGPHPATAELRAYATGTLTPAKQHRIEAHTLDCERCADLIDGFSMSDAAATDQAVATLRARLQARTSTGQPRQLPAPRWAAWPRLAAAAALLGTAVAGGIWGLEQRSAPDTVAITRTEFPQPTAKAPPRTSAEAAPAAASPSAAADDGAVFSAPEPTDYAAIRPAPAATRSAARRMASRAPERVRPPEQEAKADYAMRTEASTTSETTLPPATADAAPAPASVAAAPLAPNIDEVQAKESAADDFAVGRAKAVAGESAKAKDVSLAAKTATARVANTPMPASPRINPAPVGGSPALREYLRSEAAGFEPEAPATRLTGTVRLKFVVGADGKLSELKVIRGIRADYDAEALRIVCEGPAWQPGISGGRRAPLPMEITVPF